MNIIISPAKKMNVREDELDSAGLPCFLSKAEILKEYVRNLSREEARNMWACNERIAALNYERFRNMDLTSRLTPALLSYEGIQYQYMAPQIFTKEQWEYVCSHLRILSGFYGVLRADDGVVPYRLEMQAKLKTDFCASMYDFWGEDLARLLDGEGVLLNLASAEYSRSVLPHLPPGIRVITPIFGERNGAERVVEKGVYVKMARGEMVRFLAEQGTDKPDALTEFDRLGFRCYSELSTPERPVFLRT